MAAITPSDHTIEHASMATDLMETMAKERANPPFNIRKLSSHLHGSPRSLLLKEQFMLEISRSPLFRLDDIPDLTKEQVRERTMEKFGWLAEKLVTEPLDVFGLRMQLISIADPGFWTRFGVHYGLFLGALRSGATSAQFNYWIEKGALGLNGVIGCFAMTELRGGSNVAALETTATFDSKTDEFVIHTPTLTATKWWIGGAASTATHAAVFAQLIIGGKKHGVKTFIVQLRDPKTFTTRPGISIGDIGAKMGRGGIDNGHIQFTYVRVPRAHMLMKHTQVDRSGNVTDPPMAQLTYGALLSGRVSMVADASNTAKKALTIAIRYGAVRRQFASGKNKIETQLLDYPTHMRRLFPLAAQAIAIGFTSLILSKMYEELSSAMETLEPGDPKLNETLDMLKETHATSSGLKAFTTWSTLEAIDKARQACGGVGYSSYNAFAGMHADFAVQCTWEGDNTILALQSGRALIGSYNDSVKGKKLAPGVAYLSSNEIRTAKLKGGFDLENIDIGWKCVAANVVKRAAEEYASFLKQGMSRDEAMEKCSQSRFIASKLHTTGYIFRMFRKATDDIPAGPEKDVLVMICKLYGMWQMEEQAASFLKYGFLSGSDMDNVQASVDALCLDFRKVAIPVTDSFALSDHILNAPIGRYDGDVYNAFFEKVRSANPVPKEHPYFHRLIKPLLERGRGVNGERLTMEEDVGQMMGLDEELKEMHAERKGSEQSKAKL